jgi:hypothetical protein
VVARGVAAAAGGVLGADAVEAAGVAEPAGADVGLADGVAGARVAVGTGGPTRKATAPRLMVDTRVKPTNTLIATTNTARTSCLIRQ